MKIVNILFILSCYFYYYFHSPSIFKSIYFKLRVQKILHCIKIYHEEIKKNISFRAAYFQCFRCNERDTREETIMMEGSI